MRAAGDAGGAVHSGERGDGHRGDGLYPHPGGQPAAPRAGGACPLVAGDDAPGGGGGGGHVPAAPAGTAAARAGGLCAAAGGGGSRLSLRGRRGDGGLPVASLPAGGAGVPGAAPPPVGHYGTDHHGCAGKAVKMQEYAAVPWDGGILSSFCNAFLWNMPYTCGIQ